MLERFLRYVRVDTQGEYRVPERPSTQKQLDLSRLLVDELREIVFDAMPGASMRRHLGFRHTIAWTKPS